MNNGSLLVFFSILFVVLLLWLSDKGKEGSSNHFEPPFAPARGMDIGR